MPTFTIIIPHKNIPNLLIRCLNSIPDIEDIQLIVVDDNSNQDIVDFKHFPGLERKFTQVIFDKEAKGAGHARNVAIPLAKGKWILFADADDFFTTGFYDTICKYQQAEEDLIIFNVESVMSNNVEVKSVRATYYAKLFDRYRLGIISSRDASVVIRVPWGKMIKTILVASNNIFFDEIIFSEDVMFSTKLACHAKNILMSDDVIYTVTERDDSVSSNINKRAGSILFWMDIRIQANYYLISHGYPPQSLIPIFITALRNSCQTFVKAAFKAAMNGMLFIGASDIFKPKDKRKWI